MFRDYTKLVLQDYEKKRDNNALSLGLSRPTAAKLREECISVCEKRFSRKDGRVLAAFFGEGDDKAAVLKAIHRSKPDEFKPLNNYLNKKTVKTEDKNIELLAWLIDFEGRPYDMNKKYDDGPEQYDGGIEQEVAEEKGIPEPLYDDEAKTKKEAMPLSIQLEEKDLTLEAKIQQPVPSRPRPRFRPVLLLTFILLPVLTGFLVYRTIKNRKAESPVGYLASDSGSCMYWAGDHYQQIPCNQKKDDALVVALDSQRLNHFRKIPCPGTIKESDMKRVWYVRLNDTLEFYTSDGFHPVEIKRRLKPLTSYMYNKYILNWPPCK